MVLSPLFLDFFRRYSTMKTDELSVKIQDFQLLSSTNTYAKENIAFLEDCTLIAAEEQSAGRGRNGRSWISPGKEENIYCSFVMKQVSDPFRATIVSSLAVLSLLEKHIPGGDIFIKWPNDIFAGDAKICGVLCECTAQTKDSPLSVIAGMGLNVNTPQKILDAIPQKAASMFSLTGTVFQRKKLLGELAEYLLKYYINYVQCGNVVFREWKEKNRVLGKWVELEESTGKRRFVRVKDIAEDGRLLCEEEGKEFLFSSGDVRLVKNPELFRK